MLNLLEQEKEGKFSHFPVSSLILVLLEVHAFETVFVILYLFLFSIMFKFSKKWKGKLNVEETDISHLQLTAC